MQLAIFVIFSYVFCDAADTQVAFHTDSKVALCCVFNIYFFINLVLSIFHHSFQNFHGLFKWIVQIGLSTFC